MKFHLWNPKRKGYALCGVRRQRGKNCLHDEANHLLYGPHNCADCMRALKRKMNREARDDA